MSEDKPKLIDKATLTEELKKQYKDLWINLGNPVILDTDLGFVMIPTSKGRANAWICSYCHKTPYADPLITKAEMDLDIPYEEDIPFTTYFTPEGQPESEMRSIEFHFPCAEKLGIIKKFLPDKNGNKFPLTMIEVHPDLTGDYILVENSFHLIKDAFKVCRSCSD